MSDANKILKITESSNLDRVMARANQIFTMQSKMLVEAAKVFDREFRKFDGVNVTVGIRDALSDLSIAAEDIEDAVDAIEEVIIG